jgi:tetratricopeptide (TPR) repeat protein
VLVRIGDAGAARTELERQRRHLEREGAPIEEKLRVLNPESIIAAQQEDGAALHRVGEEMLELSTRAGDTYFEARAHTVLAHSAYIRSDFAAIRHHYSRAIPLFELLGDARSLHATYVNMSEFEMRVGRIDKALEYLDRTEVYSRQLNLPDGNCVVAVNRARALMLRGSFERALEYAREAHGITEKFLEPRFMVESALVLGALEWLTGAPGATARIQRAVAVCFEAEDWHNASDGLCWLVDAYVAAGNVGAAQIHGSRLAEVFAAHEDAAVHASRICRTLGRLASAAGSAAEAREWMRRGRAFLADALRRFEDPKDAEAYSALPFNRELLGHANGRETRTARRSS